MAFRPHWLSTAEKLSMESNFEIGAWYLNPMMELYGHVKARYTKVSEILIHAYDDDSSYRELLFDECVMPDGTHYLSTDPFIVNTLAEKRNTKFTQSNSDYDAEMVKVSEEEVFTFKISAPYGI